MNNKALFLKIETVPDCERLEHFTDNERVKTLLEEGDTKTLAMTAEFCKVAAMGYAIEGDDTLHSTTTEHHSEADILQGFWKLAAKYKPLVGFNILAFDIRVILIRSKLLGIVPSRPPFDLRSWGNDIKDLFKIRFPYGEGISLHDLAIYYGIYVPLPGVTGAEVGTLLKEDPDKLREYSKSNIEIIREVYKFYSGYFYEGNE